MSEKGPKIEQIGGVRQASREARDNKGERGDKGDTARTGGQRFAGNDAKDMVGVIDVTLESGGGANNNQN